MPKGFSEHEKDLIRQRLMAQGYKQFTAFGLKKTTVEELAAAAGISKGAFYLFFDSKEALFLEVAEETVERRFRQDLLAMLDRPGPSPRARLLAVLRQAFALFNTIPLLKFLAGSDYDLLMRRVPPEKLREHLAGDQAFFEELIARCRSAGIPIRVAADEIRGLLYALFLAAVHQDEGTAASAPLPGVNGRAFDTLLELVAAYCLGEVELNDESRD
ncbi:MAG: TetR/AcrR family transcriptional regulator [Nitrososphaerales archaeon]